MHTKRTCPTCGQDFVPTNGAQRFCPPTTKDRARAIKKQATSYCARRYQNHMHRHGTPPPIASVPEPYDCAHCGKACVPGENVAPHASRFCGYDCKAEWHRRNVEHKRPQALIDAEVWSARVDSMFFTTSRMDEARYRRVLKCDPCAYCGGDGGALDHINPRQAGGVDDWTNRTSACRDCNSLKGTLPLLLALPWIPVAAEYHGMRRVLHAA